MSTTYSISNRLDSFAEQRLSWLLPVVAVVVCVAIAWQSSAGFLVAEPALTARHSLLPAPEAERISTLKPVVIFEQATHLKQDDVK